MGGDGKDGIESIFNGGKTIAIGKVHLFEFIEREL
jgi:hypothetical protein